jgi:hypothetical protein
MIFPFASIRPKMELGLPPVTRLSATELTLGWLKRTDSVADTSKLAQSIASVGVD